VTKMLFIGGPNDGARNMIAELHPFFKVPVPRDPQILKYLKDMRSDTVMEIFTYKLVKFCGFAIYVDPKMSDRDIVQMLLNNYYPEIESVH
jgi:hypothetical protein